jgi:hypothetical protein
VVYILKHATRWIWKNYSNALVAKMDANQAKAEANRKANKEDIKTNQAELLAKLSADRQGHQRELKEMMENIMNSNHDETMACQTTEAHLENELTSVDRKPEAAEQQEVPVEDAKVMSVGEPKKKQHRDRKLAAEHCRQEPKDTKKINGGPQEKFAVARRRRSHHATVAWQKGKRSVIRMSPRATVARCMRDILRANKTQEKCRPRRESG